MIRIDEIYDTTFWPWFQNNQSGTRVFFCDPPGHTDPEHLFNHGQDHVLEKDYVYFHDQEPVDSDLYDPLFQTVLERNTDLLELFEAMLTRTAESTAIDGRVRPEPGRPGHVVVSEQGEYVEQLAQRYGWQTHYYFYHGWAALDWYRGYDRTYLIARARDRQPTRTFISPNRIVGGHRDHRVLFLYNVFKNNLQNNHISAPRICPYEGVDIASIAQKYQDVYPDIVEVLNRAELPRLFSNESTQQMSSYHLTNFAEAADSLIYVATETVYSGNRRHLTEKTFRPIALEMPFVLVAPAHSLAYLREYGFETFHPYIDETYDTVEDPVRRLECVTQILTEIQARSAAAKQELWQNLLPRIEHNRNHFYSGAFAEVLWAELQAMLAEFDEHV
jgi:hypothetical protein